MNARYYVGDGVQKPKRTPVALPASRRAEMMRADKYIADPGLVDACNVALLLGQPLLLTGEPGTGKTMFAYSLAWELGVGEPLKFETKSTSGSRDLFYTYDSLRRFHDAQSGLASGSSLPYLQYQALGMAILRSRHESEVRAFLPLDFVHPGKCRSVVLIDEVDKAPRDFPNDLLNELEQMYFRVPELGDARIAADPELQPVVVITSNSERDLPDAFLRRCIYYDIPFPSQERLQRIVSNRLGLFSAGSSAFLGDALDLFFLLRSPSSGLRKKPATAELLGWMMALRQSARAEENPLVRPGLALRTLSNLVKTAEDQGRATEIVRQWVNGRQA